ncbi:MAG: fimbrillin family protein [Rikenellaceae bacterium]
MKNIAILLLSIITLSLASCKSDDSTTLDLLGSKSISFYSEITRVSGNTFEVDDIISVAAFDSSGDLYGDVKSYTHDGECFESSSPFVLEGGSSLSYVATYPYTNGIGSDFTFTIESDQTTTNGYTNSDLLTATVAETSSSKPTLQFGHKMSNLVIILNITDNGVAATSPTVTDLKISALNTATCNIANNSFVATGVSTAITPSVVTTDTQYSAIIAPQYVAISTAFASVTINGEIYTWNVTSGVTFASGYKYEYTWSIDIADKSSDIQFTGDILDWKEGSIDDSSTTSPNDTADQPIDSGSDTTTEDSSSSSALTPTSISASDFSIANGTDITTQSYTISTFTFTFTLVSTPTAANIPTFVDEDNTYFKMTKESTMKISSSGGNMKKITLTLSGSVASVDVGEMSGSVWSGDAAEVTFTFTSSAMISGVNIE